MSDGRRGDHRSEPKGTRVVQSVARAVGLLRELFYSPEGETLAALSKRLGGHRTTTLRLLQTLVAEGMVRKDAATGRYRFDPAVWIRSTGALGELFSIASAAQQVLDDLSAATGATALILMPDEQRGMAVSSMYSLPDAPVRLDPTNREGMPIHTVAGGKCYLASLPEARLERWLGRGLAQATERTVVSPELLKEELARVRERGYALNRAEALEGIWGLAVPLHDETGTVVGGVSLALPTADLTEEQIQRWLPSLRETAAKLSAVLYGGSEGRQRSAKQRPPKRLRMI